MNVQAPVKDQRFWRQLDLVSPEKLNEFDFVVVGAGSVGSWAIMALAKMGAQNIVVWDRDVVEEHNAAVQVYSADNLGRRKVDALTQHIRDLAGVNLTVHDDHVHKDTAMIFGPNTILVMAVDNMEARAHLWQRAKACPSVKLVVDCRMGGEVLRLYAVDPINPDHVTFYDGNLYSDAQAENLPCTAQAVVYTSLFAAAFISSIVGSFVKTGATRNEVVFHCRELKLISSEA